MASSVRVDDNSDAFKQLVKIRTRMALEDAGSDMLVIAKNLAPVAETGQLRGDTDVEPVRIDGVKVWFNKEYASYQERGARADGSHQVRNYTTAGTTSHFLETAGTHISNVFEMKYLRKFLGGIA